MALNLPDTIYTLLEIFINSSIQSSYLTSKESIIREVQPGYYSSQGLNQHFKDLMVGSYLKRI